MHRPIGGAPAGVPQPADSTHQGEQLAPSGTEHHWRYSWIPLDTLGTMHSRVGCSQGGPRRSHSMALAWPCAHHLQLSQPLWGVGDNMLFTLVLLRELMYLPLPQTRPAPRKVMRHPRKIGPASDGQLLDIGQPGHGWSMRKGRRTPRLKWGASRPFPDHRGLGQPKDWAHVLRPSFSHIPSVRCKTLPGGSVMPEVTFTRPAALVPSRLQLSLGVGA